MLPAAAVLAGVGVAAGIVTAPGDTLDAVAARLDLAAILPAAAPPLGATARTLLGLGLGMLVALVGCAGHLRRWLLPLAGHRDVPMVRRADAHPDAPPRRPIRASEDLGQPLPIIAAPDAAVAAEPEPPLPWMTPPPERRLPRDLDLPMSVFDPGAVPAEPLEPVRPVPPLTLPSPVVPTPVVAAPIARPALIDPGERFETVALPPAPVGEATIASLLDRLERGAARRQATAAAATPAPVSLDETLQRLRRLATG